MTSLSLRLATPADIPALHRLEQAAFPGDRLSLRSWRRLVRQGSAAVVLAELYGELCGDYVLLFSRRTSVARLYSLAVAAPWRRRGVARALVEDSARRATGRGSSRLRLETRADNRRAQELFAGLGFRPFTQVADYYEDGEAALRYERRLQGTP